MRGRFDAATGLVALGAVLLFVSLFIRWYKPGGDAWQVFEIVDLVLLGAAIAGLTAAFADPLRFAGLARWMPLIAASTLVIVVVQGIEPPPAAHGASREAGFWIALAGSLLMGAGAAMSAADVAVTIDVRDRVRRAAIDARRGAAPPDGPDEPLGPDEPFATPPPPPPPADEQATTRLTPNEDA